MGLFDFLFNGKKQTEALKHALKSGAKVVDVRSAGEFKGGHYEGAINIPLDKLNGNVAKLKAYNKPIVVYCASGIRSGAAARILKANGIETYNGKTMYKVFNLAGE